MSDEIRYPTSSVGMRDDTGQMTSLVYNGRSYGPGQATVVHLWMTQAVLAALQRIEKRLDRIEEALHKPGTNPIVSVGIGDN